MRRYIAAVVAKIESHVGNSGKIVQSMQLSFVRGEKADGIGNLRFEVAVSETNVETESAVGKAPRATADVASVMNAVRPKVAVGEESIHSEVIAAQMKNTAGHK